MNRKKWLPLALLAAGAVLLGILLAVLTREKKAETDTGRRRQAGVLRQQCRCNAVKRQRGELDAGF